MATTRIVSSLLAALGLTAAAGAGAQNPVSDVNGYVTLASGYWKHGLSQNDGATLQLGIDYQHYTGFFVGAWAANVDFERDHSAEEPREIEANAYLGYHRRTPNWSWTLGLGHYAYPGAALGYEYEELSATVGYRDRVFYTAAYSDDYYGVQRTSLNQEVSGALPLRGDVEIGAALGYFAIEQGGPDITYWNVGVSKLVRRMALDLRYYDSNYEWSSYYGDPDADHYVLSVSYALGGRSSQSSR